VATAALVAAVAVWIAFTVPPARRVLTETPATSDGTVSGVLHIHTDRSDGRSAPDAVAVDAARAGLKFIVLTDHGDATRVPDPPAYRSGVLVLDGVEISTSGGHYIAIGLPSAPYPLRGEARDVVEDVGRLGGFGIAAHPDSPKRELQWDGWSAPFDGLEVINPDTSWRVHATTGSLLPKFKLFDAILTFPIRPAETIASLLTDASPLVERWERLTRTRRVVAVVGTDAHSLIGPIPAPSYESSFRMLSVHVKPSRVLSGDAAADAQAIIEGLRGGHVYSIVDGFATAPSFEFGAANLTGTAEAGDELADGGPVTLRVRTNAPPSFTTTIWRGNQVLGTSHHEPSFTVVAPAGPAVYRVDIRSSDPLDLPPWLVSNPIYVRPSGYVEPRETRRIRPAVETRRLFDGHDISSWRLERNATSVGDMGLVGLAGDAGGPGEAGKGEIRVHYQLPRVEVPENRVALIAAFPQFLAPYDRVTFSARADRPMRMSVQLRTERPGGVTERWGRSVYVDETRRSLTVDFDDLSPIGTVAHRTAPLADIPYILFVVDPSHTAAGAAGEFWISDAMLER
jgi:hypothetical protein